MPRCPHCRHHFRTLDDEIDMHDCPHCGYGPDTNVGYCIWCNDRYTVQADDESPYCSTLCALQALQDSDEDRHFKEDVTDVS